MGKNNNNKNNGRNTNPKNPGGGSFTNNIITAFFIFLAVVFFYSILIPDNSKTQEVPISQIAIDAGKGLISEITVNGEDIKAKYADGSDKTSKKEAEISISETLLNYGVPKDKISAIKIAVENSQGLGFWFLNLAPFILPVIFVALLIWYLTRQVRGAGMQAFTFGQSKARITFPHDKKQKVTFKDVAGAKEAKEELKEIVDFLKNPKKFLDIGAQIPKGVLLMGASGTGKTLLARAVAGEAGVAFFSISGSEFVELFVGIGASRVRDLFQIAKKAAPAIIFIDEIDAVGRVRGTGVGGGNDEREQTLNQILVEMDGFEPNEKLVIMAATNRPDVLDPALVRPGRFDRRVIIDLPDRKDREEILKIHSAKKPFAEDVSLLVIAERTPGFSGADLYSLMNEAAILAARENRTKVSQYDLIRSIEKVLLGPERKSHLLSVKEKEITAFHEAGHALVASVLLFADPVHKISIISRGRAAGYTLKLPIEDRRLQSKKEFLDDITVSLGGYVAEKAVFDDLTTGPSNDLQIATALARDMVTKYGMSDKLGPVAFEGASGQVIFGKGFDEKEYSEKVGAQIDAEVSEIIEEASRRAKEVITTRRAALDAIASKLIEVETIERDDFEKILIANGITPKKKLDIEHQT